MKNNIKFFALVLVSLTITFESCNNKEEIIEVKREVKDYSSQTSQQRILLAKSLIEAFNNNNGLDSTVVRECNKKFDGDANVLCSDLVKKKVAIGDISTTKIEECLSKTKSLQQAQTINESNDVINSIIAQDSLIQIYYYTTAGATGYEGIVVVPENVQERDGKDLLLIKKDGTETYIKSDVEPEKNYLVISRNERSGFNANFSKVISSENRQNINNASGKDISITKASFTTYAAKIAVEDWWGGEPEVRLNILCPFVSPTTSLVTEVRNTTFLYPGSWLKSGVFKNTVKWNTTLVQGAFWDIRTKDYGRRLIWTEEDGTSAAKTVTTTIADSKSGITTTWSTSIPSSNGDKVISDNWIDYTNTPAGIQNWGSITFEISYP